MSKLERRLDSNFRLRMEAPVFTSTACSLYTSVINHLHMKVSTKVVIDSPDIGLRGSMRVSEEDLIGGER